MTVLWLRSWRVRVETIDIVGTFSEGNQEPPAALDCAFEVTRTIQATPNKCKLTVYNLNARHRGTLTRLSAAHAGIPVEIYAGYGSGAPPVIFRGDLRSYKEKRDAAGTYVSEIEGSDGGRALLVSRVNRAYPPGTRIDRVLLDLAEALGIGPGNAQELSGAAYGDRTTFPDGVTVSGSASVELGRLLRGAGFSYSIQNGALQVLRFGEAVQATALVLSPSSGLLEAAPGANRAVDVRALLVPDLYPGRFVRIDGAEVHGFYRVRAARWKGDTSGGGPWEIMANCTPLHTSTP